MKCEPFRYKFRDTDVFTVRGTCCGFDAVWWISKVVTGITNMKCGVYYLENKVHFAASKTLACLTVHIIYQVGEEENTSVW